VGIPSKVQKLIRGYVQSEEEQDSWDVSQLHGFVDQLTNELIDVYKVDDTVMALQGFDPESNEDYSFINTLALPKANSEEEEE